MAKGVRAGEETRATARKRMNWFALTDLQIAKISEYLLHLLDKARIPYDKELDDKIQTR